MLKRHPQIPPLNIMNPLCIHVKTQTPDEITNSMEHNELHISEMKFGDAVARRYPFRWVSAMRDESFHPGIHLLCTEQHSRLPIVYASDNNSLLLRITPENVRLKQILQAVEDKIRATLPPDEKSMLQPILRTPDSPGYDQSISVKCRYTSVDESESDGTLAKHNTLTKAVIKLQKLNYYMGKIYPSLQLVACCVSQSGTSDTHEGHQTEEDYFSMMQCNSDEMVYAS
jgi:hypothetical protein